MDENSADGRMSVIMLLYIYDNRGMLNLTIKTEAK